MVSNTVYVLGAGFARGVGIPVSKELVSNEEFSYLKNKLKRDLDIKKIENLQSYVQFRIENEYCDKNVESVLNHLATAKYLYMESTTEDKTYDAETVFEDLLWYIARIIKEKMADNKEDIPEEFFTFLKSVYNNRDVIVTFNYDILLEVLLTSLGFGYGYGIDEKKNEREQLILKLHGSLNWGKCSKCGPVNVHDKILSYETTSAVKCPLCKSKIFSPLLIPPAIYKDSYYNDQFFGPLIRESWSLASEKISNAKRIS